MKAALVLIAHGSRNPSANADLFDLAGTITDYAGVFPSFLELAEPTIPEAAAQAVASGATRIVLAPYFLSAGVHVRRDLEMYRNEFAARFPEAEFVLAAPLGPHPLLRELVLLRAAEAVDAKKPRG